MGWFWADKDAKSDAKSPVAPSAGGCPVRPAEPVSACPVDHSKFSKKPAASSTKQECPVNHDSLLNPMNNMPMDISTEMAPGQKIKLSTDRVISSIPKGEASDQGLWEYPSPQQMLNAMLKKGKGDGVPEDAVESMVEIHNFLNEGAWQQILEWESKYTQQTKVEPRLLQFTGRPNDLSPRARSYLFLSNIFPSYFNSQPPFDRHDWTVLRSNGKNEGWRKIRYVIDYYSAPDDEETGMPSFVLDTRPALDNPLNALDRWTHWSGPLWSRAMGDFSESG